MTDEATVQNPAAGVAGTTIIAATAQTLRETSAAPAFNKAANDFIHGELRQESLDAVEKLHQRFTQRIQATVDAALKDSNDEQLKKACVEYCIALSRTRKECTPKQLAEKAAAGTDAIKAETKSVLGTLAELEESLQKTLENKRNGKDSWGYALPATNKEEGEAPHPFAWLMRGLRWIFKGSSTKETSAPAETPVAANDDAPAVEAPEPKAEVTPPAAELPEIPQTKDDSGRIYFRLSDYSKSPVQPLIEDYLKNLDKGYTVCDYAGGYAMDNRKNKVKIGKLLKDRNKGLYEAFLEDGSRTSNNLVVVLTKSYEDLARASYGRGWQSCRANASSAVSYAVSEIDIGVMAAYLIREDDPEIHDPLGRINLKPYDSCREKASAWGGLEQVADKGKDKQTVYLTFNPIGLHHPGFVDAVNRYADEKLNGAKYGTFKLRDGCESYQEFQTRRRIPMDAEGALQAIGAKYTKDESGKITVPGDINLSGFGLSRLPDLRDVTVEGGVDVSNNKLLTLEGLPQNKIKFLNASKNLLICFAGAPPEVAGGFSYQDCCYLQTTFGAPKAATYSYGNGRRDDSKYKSGDKLVGPVEEPDRFPGFKRKD